MPRARGRMGETGPVEFAYLGDLVVAEDGRPIELKGGRLRALLVLLLLDVGRPVSARALIEALWAEDPPADPANALQSLVSRLRRTLGPGAPVDQTTQGYRLQVDPDRVDAVRFERLVAAGTEALERADLATAVRSLDDALALWRATPLPDDESPEVVHVRSALEDTHLRASVARAEADLRSGHPAAALARIEPPAEAFPLREDLAALRLRCLIALQRPAEALAAYERTRIYLRDTLGSDPSPRLRGLHAEVLALADAPASARDDVPTNLAPVLTSFLGREEDAAAILERLTRGRLVTLVGTGGAGKTRLASEVAAGVVGGAGPEAPDGVWFVELAPLVEPENLPFAFVDALSLRDTTVLDTRMDRARTEVHERVLGALRGMSCLLVVDNCEHVIEAAAELVDEILTRCPGVRVLATSREPLAVDGELLHPLSPLPVPGPESSPEELSRNTAVRLLLDRATASGADLTLDAVTAGPVADVVRRLDGLPLAIELAAARLRAMTVAEVAARLGDRFSLLTGGRRTALPRHRTLRAVVEWSWDLLSEAEREVAEHFSVFVAGADADAVAAVCPRFAALYERDAVAARDAAADVLVGLVDKSILVPQTQGVGTRFRMLETLREFGADRLAEQGVTGRAHTAAAAYFTQLAARADRLLRSREQTLGLRILDAERENVLAALAFWIDQEDGPRALGLAMSLGWFWTLRDSERDAARWFGDALAVPGAAELPMAAVAQGWLLVTTTNAGLSPRQESTHPIPDPAATADALRRLVGQEPTARLLLALVLSFSGAKGEATEVLDDTLVSEQDPWLRAAAVTVMITLAENDGDVETVRRHLDEAIERWTELGDPWGIAVTMSLRGSQRMIAGDLDGAAADLETAREGLREMGGLFDEVFIRTRVADILLRRGDLEAARRLAAEIEVWRPPPGREALRSTLSIMGGALLAAIAVTADDRDEMARTADRLGRVLTRDVGPSGFESHPRAIGYAALVHLELRLGERAAALENGVRAYELSVETQDYPIMAACALAAVDLAQDRGEAEHAASMLGASARLRGVHDATNAMVVVLRRNLVDDLGEAAFTRAFDAGRALSQQEALLAVDPRPVPALAGDGAAKEVQGVLAGDDG